MTEERWLAVLGWEGLYEVSDFGRVRSLDRVVVDRNNRPMRYRGVVLKQNPTPPMGYWSVHLNKHGRQQTKRVHVLVLEAFVGPRPAGLIGCHRNGDLNNNAPTNLRWDTHKSNSADMLKHGRHQHAGKTHCKRKHDLSVHGYLKPSGGRQCRACQYAAARSKYAATKGVSKLSTRAGHRSS